MRQRPRARRVMGVAGLVVVVVGTAVACDPGGLGSAAVAYTTDRTATAELDRRDVSVRWLTCTAGYGGDASASGRRTPSASRTSVASVDCQGRTTDGREITVTGEVTRAVNGACVRGDLTATVGGRTVFHVDGLGDCSATAAPADQPPPATRGQPGPTVTVTVTRTVWCGNDPACRPVEGK